MTKSVKTYPGNTYREIWEEFREIPEKYVAISREFPGREIPAANPKLCYNERTLESDISTLYVPHMQVQLYPPEFHCYDVLYKFL